MSWLLIIFLFCSRTTHFSAWRINSRTPPGKWYLEIFLKYKFQHLFTSFVLKQLIQIYLGKPCPAQSTILRLALAQQQNSGQREFIQEKGNWQWYMWSLLTRDRNGMAHHVWVPLCKGLLGVAPGVQVQTNNINSVEDIDMLACPENIQAAHFDGFVTLCCWLLWKRRNELVFQREAMTMRRFLSLCSNEAQLWNCRLPVETSVFGWSYFDLISAGFDGFNSVLWERISWNKPRLTSRTPWANNHEPRLRC